MNSILESGLQDLNWNPNSYYKNPITAHQSITIRAGDPGNNAALIDLKYCYFLTQKWSDDFLVINRCLSRLKTIKYNIFIYL